MVGRRQWAASIRDCLWRLVCARRTGVTAAGTHVSGAWGPGRRALLVAGGGGDGLRAVDGVGLRSPLVAGPRAEDGVAGAGTRFSGAWGPGRRTLFVGGEEVTGCGGLHRG